MTCCYWVRMHLHNSRTYEMTNLHFITLSKCRLGTNAKIPFPLLHFQSVAWVQTQRFHFLYYIIISMSIFNSISSKGGTECGAFWGHFNVLLGILEHMKAFWDIWRHFGNFEGILGYFKAFYGILRHFGAFEGILGHLKAFWDVWRHF